MSKHGLFVRGGHPTDEMREKIQRGVKRHWETRSARSDKIMEAETKRKQIDEWLAAEREKLAKQ